MAEKFGWESVFYTFGSAGCIWFIFWIVLVFDGPSVHPRISQVYEALTGSCSKLILVLKKYFVLGGKRLHFEQCRGIHKAAITQVPTHEAVAYVTALPRHCACALWQQLGQLHPHVGHSNLPCQHSSLWSGCGKCGDLIPNADHKRRKWIKHQSGRPVFGLEGLPFVRCAS